jgi:tripeptidyl-peptidase I
MVRIFQTAVLLSASLQTSFSTFTSIVHEKRHEFSGLERGARVDATSITKFRIALKQSNLDNGYDYLLNISHPSSPHYGKLWTPEEVRKTFAPDSQSIDAVRAWLGDHGITEVTERNGWLSFKSPVGSVESLIDAHYYEFDDFEGRGVRIGCDQ